MGPVAAISQAVARSFTFSGRASRSEYWWFFALYCLIMMVCIIFDVLRFASALNNYGVEGLPNLGQFALFTMIAWVVMLPTMLSLSMRRLEDAGYSPYWAVLYVIPVATLVLIAMNTMPSVTDNIVSGTPAAEPTKPTTGKPVPVDAQKRAMQGYALLFDKDKKVSPETQAARKAEVSDYYRTQVLKSAKPA